MKQLTTALTALFLAFSLMFPLLPRTCAEDEVFVVDAAETAAPSMEKALSWAVETAEDPAFGYSQKDRFGPNYDCSSFVSAALMAGGFDLGGFLSTSGLPAALTDLGFVRLRRTEVVLLPGDILFSPGTHVELYLGDGKCVAAHQDYDRRSGDSKDKEIQVRDVSECAFCRYGQYRWVYRYMPDRPSNYDPQATAQKETSSLSLNK